MMKTGETALRGRPQDPQAPPCRVYGFLLVPGFALMSYASAIEPLRAANVISGQPLYAWRHLSCDATREARASNGITIACDADLRDANAVHALRLDTLIVCAGGNPVTFDDAGLLRALRRTARAGIRMGGVSGGPFLLARAGLLDGYRSTIHWEHQPALSEHFPELAMTGSLYEIDRERLTCAGGIAALDMMASEIDAHHGPELAGAVSEWFIQDGARPGSGPQRSHARADAPAPSRPVATALALMSAHLENPLGIDTLACRAGIGQRQLERRFMKEIGAGVMTHYRVLRLERARALLRQTRMQVVEVALACGFSSASQFSRACKAHFGHAPVTLRKFRYETG